MIALRVKGESVEQEIEGALAALDCRIDRIAVDLSRPVVAIPSYNGARKMANLTPLLACLLADAGVQVIVHGVTDDAVRTTTHQIIRAMGIARRARRRCGRPAVAQRSGVRADRRPVAGAGTDAGAAPAGAAGRAQYRPYARQAAESVAVGAVSAADLVHAPSSTSCSMHCSRGCASRRW